MCRVRAPGGALAGTVSDIKLPGVVLFLCVSNESRINKRADLERNTCIPRKVCSLILMRRMPHQRNEAKRNRAVCDSLE